MTDILIGATGESNLLVTNDIAISFLELTDARVLGTPWLILNLEITARNLVKPYLLDTQDTVGTQVNVAHLAATPLGMKARFCAEILRVEGKRVTFRVEAFDQQDKIAEGTHERYIIDIARFASRVAAKRDAAFKE